MAPRPITTKSNKKDTVSSSAADPSGVQVFVINAGHQDFRYGGKSAMDKGYIRYGVANDLPNRLLELYDEASFHGLLIQRQVEMIIGNGLTGTPETIKALVRLMGGPGNYERNIEAAVLDLVIYGGFYFRIKYNPFGIKVASANQLPCQTIRIGGEIQNPGGRFKATKAGENWDWKGKTYKTIEYKLSETSTSIRFNKQNPEQVMRTGFFNPSNPGGYFRPRYVSALHFIELERDFALFHRSNIQNGMVPSTIVTVFTANTSPDQVAGFKRQLKEQYSGPQNAGKIIVLVADDPDGKALVQPFEVGNAHKLYESMNSIITDNVMAAHGAVSPVVAGKPGTGTLGGNGNEIKAAYAVYDATTINTYRKKFNEFIKALAARNGLDTHGLGLESANIFDTAVGVDEGTDPEKTAAPAGQEGKTTTTPVVTQPVGPDGEPIKEFLVGELTAMLDISKNYFAGEISRSAAKAMLERLFHLTPEEADSFLDGQSRKAAALTVPATTTT